MLEEESYDTFLDKAGVGQCFFLGKQEVNTVLPQLGQL